MVAKMADHTNSGEEHTNMSDENNTDNNDDMAKKLKTAMRKVEKAKTERHAKTVKGGHLNPTFLQMVTERGLEQDEKSGFIKVTAQGRTAKLYVAKKGGRVDLSFPFDAPGVKQITEEEAKQRHLGKVRCQLDFEQGDETLTEAFAGALAYIASSPMANVRPPRAVKPVEAVTETTEPVDGETPAEENVSDDESESAVG